MGNKLNDITVGMIYLAITSGIGELADDTGKGPVCYFGNTCVSIADECAPDMGIDEILCIIDMKELAQSIYKRICDLSLSKQSSILNYINSHL